MDHLRFEYFLVFNSKTDCDRIPDLNFRSGSGANYKHLNQIRIQTKLFSWTPVSQIRVIMTQNLEDNLFYLGTMPQHRQKDWQTVNFKN